MKVFILILLCLHLCTIEGNFSLIKKVTNLVDKLEEAEIAKQNNSVPILSMFYCGFGGDYCGQSIIDDVNPLAHIIILAFANTLPDGKIIVDDSKFPSDYVNKWRKNGQKVVLSVGGQNGNWAVVFSSQTNINNFIQSVTDNLKRYRLDGIDLDIEGYLASPRTVAQAIIDLKKSISTLGKKLLIVSPEDVTVYQGVAIPDPDRGGQAFNYFVPIINLADSSIDYYQPQAYNNWYDGFPGGSLKYYQDVYLNWRNLQGLSPWTKPLQNFSGVQSSKLLIGLLASTQAGGAQYYGPPQVITQFKDFLKTNNYSLAGYMVWDSHWDKLNNFAISNVCSSP